jgi:hypothetical protein
MKYCLLINISRDYITFSYNKDGDVSFVPYGDELTKPLAVYCQGNEISIGSYALREVQKGNKYAHANLFDAIRSTDFIEYKGQKYDINKLLFFAIEKYVAEFFDVILMRSEGSIENNRSKLPLVLIFAPDLKVHERSFVLESLKGGGYGNVFVVNYSNRLKKVLTIRLPKETVPIFVGGDGLNLYCESPEAKFTDVLVMEGACKDPRLDHAVEIMQTDIVNQGYDQYHADLDADLNLLRKHANEFLSSGKKEKQSVILLSDNMRYDYFLKASDFGLSSKNLSESAIRAFDSLKTALSKVDILPNQCTIILVDQEISNDYVERLFKHAFSNVIRIDNEEREMVLHNLIEDIIGWNYDFSGKGTDKSKEKEASDLFKKGCFSEAKDIYSNIGHHTTETRLCVECIRNEKELKMGKLNTSSISLILDRWRDYGIEEEIIQKFKPAVSVAIPQEINASNSAKESIKLTAREIKEKIAELHTMMTKGVSTAHKQLMEFKKDLNNEGTHNFDDKIDNYLKADNIVIKPLKPIKKETVCDQKNQSEMLMSVKEAPVVKSKEIKATIAEAKGLLRSTDSKLKGKGQAMLVKLLRNLNRKDIHDYDAVINEILKQ